MTLKSSYQAIVDEETPESANPHASKARVVIREFACVGFLGFGGTAANLALFRQVFTEKGYLSNEEFAQVIYRAIREVGGLFGPKPLFFKSSHKPTTGVYKSSPPPPHMAGE